MIKTIINKFIKTALDELFINTPSVQLSMGSDMFSDSQINLSNLSFRPDIFDVLLQPLTLTAGLLGSLNVEGIAELALGGQLKFTAENLFLLFSVDENADPEKVQTMKKILIEMRSGEFSSSFLVDLVKKMLGITTGLEGNLHDKRKTLYRFFDFISKGFLFSIKNIHIRLEMRHPNDNKPCQSIGLTIPLIKIVPAPNSMRPAGLSSQNPVLLTMIRSLSVYVDYHENSYESVDSNVTINSFTSRVAEKHMVLFGLTDCEVISTLDIRRRSGIVCPKFDVRIGRVKFTTDDNQLTVLENLSRTISTSWKRFQQAIRLQKIFRSGFPLPRVSETSSVILLPHLSLRGQSFPSQCSIPTSNQVGLVAFMKDRVGPRWPVMLWKHLIRLVIYDMRKLRPYGRWLELVWLCKVRREYAFAYARLLKRTSDSSGLVYGVDSQLPATKIRDLFELEMMLPVSAIAKFRTLSHLVAAMTLFTSRKRGAVSNGKSSEFDKDCISWRDILKVYTELFESQRNPGLDRHRDDDDDWQSVDSGVSSSLPEDRTPVKKNNTISVKNVSSAQKKDSSEMKLFGKLDFSVFGEAFTSKEDRSKLGTEGSYVMTDEFEEAIKHQRDVLLSSQISETVEWCRIRHQKALSFMPPDLSLSVQSVICEMKLPLLPTAQERSSAYQLKLENLSLTFSISQSTSPDSKAALDASLEKLRNITSLASLTGCLIQLRFVVRKVTFLARKVSDIVSRSESNLTSDMIDVGNGVMGDDSPGSAVLVDKFPAKGFAGATIDTAVHTVLSKEGLLQVVASSGGEFLVFCFVLDLDEKGESAGDVQFQVGGVHCDFSSSALDALFPPAYLNSLHNCLLAVSRIQRSLSLASDPYLLIDWNSNIATVSESYWERNQKASENRHRREAVVFSDSFFYWLSVLERNIPRVLSICFRSNDILIQSIDASVLRRLVFAKLQAMMDSAVNRSHDADVASVLTLLRGLLRKEDTIRPSGNRRRWGSKFGTCATTKIHSQHSLKDEEQSLKVLIPNFELLATKVNSPFPTLELSAQGISILKVPMSDETICYYLAWLLADLLPIV